MITQRITRRTKLGFGYTDACEQDEHGYLVVCDVTRPDYSGTIAQLTEAIRSDRTLASYNGGTMYRTAWFVYTKGGAVKITDILFDYKIRDLTDKRNGKYYSDEIFVEVEAE